MLNAFSYLEIYTSTHLNQNYSSKKYLYFVIGTIKLNKNHIKRTHEHPLKYHHYKYYQHSCVFEVLIINDNSDLLKLEHRKYL